MTESFRLEKDGPVTTLTLSRPEKRNSMDAAFWEDFPDAVDEVSHGGGCRVLVIQSEGPHFSSGIDLGMFQDIGEEDLGAAKALGTYRHVQRMQRTFTALEKAPMPVIAAIQGACLGAGVDLVTACCIRLCTEDAYFSIYESVMGLTADVGTFPRVLNLLPEGIVKELSYTGRKMYADEALRLGFVNRALESHEACNDAAQALAAEIASRAPMAIHGTKDIIQWSRDHSTDDALDRIALWNASNLQPSELMAAMVAKQTGQPGQFAEVPKFRKVDGRD